MNTAPGRSLGVVFSLVLLAQAYSTPNLVAQTATLEAAPGFATDTAPEGTAPSGAALGGAAPSDAIALSVRGPDWALLLELPEGWIQDRRSLYRSGIEALFLEAGSAYPDAPALITLEPRRREAGAPITDGTAPAGDAASQDAAAGNASAAPPSSPAFILETGSFQSLSFSELPASPEGMIGFEAFLEANRLRFHIVLGARSPADLLRALPAFRSLVESLVLLEGEG